MAGKELSFEESMHRIEEIVKKLESGNCSLEESLKLFEEATGLCASCDQRLKTAQHRIEQYAAEEKPEE